ncbi:hypothetical protein Tco_0305447 [Tanacetum coccineum]
MASANTEAAPLYRPITLQLEDWLDRLDSFPERGREEGKKERHKIKQPSPKQQLELIHLMKEDIPSRKGLKAS